MPKILKENLTVNEAKEYESLYWNQYKDNDWNMINSEFMLGYVGVTNNKGWTEELIRKFVKEHPEIKRRTDLHALNGSAYKKAYELGILDDLFGPNTHKKYTKEDIFKYVSEHPELKMREDLRIAKSGMFKAAWKFGILEDLFGEVEHKEHTEEEIRNYLNEHPEIKSRKDFFNNNRNLYDAAVKRGMVYELFGERNRYVKWNKQTLKQYVDGENIKTPSELYKKKPRAYNAAKELDIFKYLFGDDCVVRNSWDEQSIRKFIEDEHISTRTELYHKNNYIYNLAKKFGILDKIFGKAERVSKWTEETIRECIENNPDIKTPKDLLHKKIHAYYEAKKLGILDKLFPQNE